MNRRPPRSTLSSSSAASDVYKRQVSTQSTGIQDHHTFDTLLKYYIRHPDEAQEIATAGQRFVRQHHMAVNRIDWVLSEATKRIDNPALRSKTVRYGSGSGGWQH
eukprot:TRINITY_DN19087_c0_g1_i1.p1 TRINITY_DN19087_c0_g1~~TRINITY_DN19087_c0_g1_i1.p1  ORF type:complete len:105 (+),score=26.29 TRINITY_DN19087_c0_g1_i1:47-361(+)